MLKWMRNNGLPLLVAVLAFVSIAYIGPHAQSTVSNQFPPVAVGLFSDFSVAVGTAAVKVIPANTARKALVMQDVGTANVSCSDTTTTPTSAGLTTITIGTSQPPLKFDGNFVPSGAFYCISASGTQNLTVKEGR